MACMLGRTSQSARRGPPRPPNNDPPITIQRGFLGHSSFRTSRSSAPGHAWSSRSAEKLRRIVILGIVILARPGTRVARRCLCWPIRWWVRDRGRRRNQARDRDERAIRNPPVPCADRGHARAARRAATERAPEEDPRGVIVGKSHAGSFYPRRPVDAARSCRYLTGAA